MDGDRVDHHPLPVPGDVRALAQTLLDHGYGVWVVGGALRDHFLGIPPKDWDLATTAPAETVMTLFPHVVPVGIRHGTVQVHTAVRGVEVTSLPPSGRPSILADLDRRDFTVNAMAFSLKDGRLLDPHEGLKDFATRTLRGVLNPRARFREDPLRTLRAGRFVSTHRFRIEERTYSGMTAESHGLARVAPERIREEVYRLLAGENVREGLLILWDGGVWSQILPELNDRRVFHHTAATVSHCPPRLCPRLAALLHALALNDTTEPRQPASCADEARLSSELAEQVLSRWRASQREIREIGLLVRHQLPPASSFWTDADLRRWMAAAGAEALEDLLALARADRIATARGDDWEAKPDDVAPAEIESLVERIRTLMRQNPPLTIRQLAVTGEDVIRLLRLHPGPQVGTLLRRLHDHVLEDPRLNTRAALTEFLALEYGRRQHENPT